MSLGLSQAALARTVGISRTALSLIENGRTRPSARTLEALERSLDPFSDPTRLVHGGGALQAAEAIKGTASETGRPYALTLDVAAWLLTQYQTPAAAWAYVRPLEEWRSLLLEVGVRPAGPEERADLVLLRASDEVLAESWDVEGHALVGLRRLVEDCARLGGRHGLDGARVYVGYPNASGRGVRLDPDAMLKVFEEVVLRT